MRGPKSTYRIQLSQEEAKHLRQMVQAHKPPQAQVIQARIVLTVHEHPDWSAPQIAQASQSSDRMVRKWRKRWLTTHSLADAPRSGAPRRFSRLSCVPTSRPRPVVCHARLALPWLVGVAAKSRAGSRTPCQRLPPQPAP